MSHILESKIEHDLDLLESCCQGFFYKELWELTKRRIYIYDGKKRDKYIQRLKKIKEELGEMK